MTKKIIVKSSGPLKPLGGINGPILTPFEADFKTIASLLSIHREVYEVGPMGKTVLLTQSNYMNDNFTKKKDGLVSKSREITNIQESLAMKAKNKDRYQFRINHSDFK